jgi:methylated-DNA-[protein]-cysteine S-methyltransferase
MNRISSSRQRGSFGRLGFESMKPSSLPTVYYGARPSSPLGALWAAASPRGAWAISYGIDEARFCEHILARGEARLVYAPGKVTAILTQLSEFLRGKRRRFDVRVDWRHMTPFQVAVRKAVMAVPYGETASYGDIAAAVGKPLAPRAVGGVQASNPLSFIIPCHRIIAADGGLGGYGGPEGLKVKAWLLQMESNRARRN